MELGSRRKLSFMIPDDDWNLVETLIKMLTIFGPIQAHDFGAPHRTITI